MARLRGWTVQLLQQPIQLSAGGGNDGAVGRKGGFLARVFVLQFRVNVSTNDEDLEAHPRPAGEGVGVFLRLRFRVAPHGF